MQGNPVKFFLLLTSLHLYPQTPFCAVLNRTGSAISRFKTAKTRRKKKGFEKNLFMLKSAYHVELI